MTLKEKSNQKEGSPEIKGDSGESITSRREQKKTCEIGQTRKGGGPKRSFDQLPETKT